MQKGKAIERDNMADFKVDRRVWLLSAIAVCLGVLSALVAFALLWLINVITNLAYFHRFSSQNASPASNHLGLVAVLVPVVGGLIVGVIARFGSEKIRGHGIPEALEAILTTGSRVEPKVAIYKPVSSAIAIGTGGPFGAEGPIIMTGGALGSLIGQLFDLSAVERRILLGAGAAAGMAAIFASPFAAVLLAVELLLFEWRPRSLIPVALASAVAGAVRVPLLGAGPIFPAPPHAALPASVLAFAFIAGLLAGLVAAVATRMVYGMEDLFSRIPIHWMWWPAIGGLIIGLGGLIDPHVLGVGYDVIHALLLGQTLGLAAAGLLVGKMLVWSIGLGSGTSGGVLAPLLIIGGALGAVFARWIPVGDPGLWVAIGMAAVLGGTLRTPLTAIVFTLEVTHDFNLLPGLLIACVAAEGVTVFLMRRSIMTEKVARRGHPVGYEYGVDPLALVRVKDVMKHEVPTVPADMSVGELAARLARPDDPVAMHQGIPIVDGQGRLVGMLTRGDVLRVLREDPLGSGTVRQAGSTQTVRAYPDELVVDAVERMLRNDVGRLPVVSRDDPDKLVGYLGRTGILEARQRHLQEEHFRERLLFPSIRLTDRRPVAPARGDGHGKIRP